MNEENLLHGIALLKSGNFKEAQTFLLKVINSDPGSEFGWLWLGYSLNDAEKSKYCFQRVLALNPKNADAWKSLDDLYNERSLSLPIHTNVDHATAIDRKFETAQPVLQEKGELNSVVGQNDAPPKPPVIYTFAFGFLLMLILVAIPSVFLISIGFFDGYFLSHRAVELPPMPPFYSIPVDNVVTPTNLPLPVEPLDERLANAEPSLNLARLLVNQNNCYDALPLLDQTIRVIPDVDEPHYLRALCTYYLLQNQRSVEEYLSNIHSAIYELDRAILINPDLGNYYALRGLLYYSWAGVQELSVDRAYLYDFAAQNFTSAKTLGTDILVLPELPLIGSRVDMGDCKNGLQEITPLLKYPNLSTQNTADIYYAQAVAYACLEDFDQALNAVNTSMQYGNVSENQKVLEAAILYQSGMADEALKILDDLIVQSPNYGGERYLLRALIVFEKGDRDEAYRSLLAGGGNSWLHGGLYSYVQAKMGLQLAGPENLARSISTLQYAEASMPIMYSAIRKRIQKELLELGSEPLEQQVTIVIRSTPLPDIQSRPTPRPTTTSIFVDEGTPSGLAATESPLQDIMIRPNEPEIILVDADTGSGPLTFSTDERKVFHFQPSSKLSLENVLSVILHLDASEVDVDPPLLYEVWNPRLGTWTLIEPNWVDTDLAYPGDYVFPEGDLFLAVRNLGNTPFELKDLSITVVFQTPDGQLLIFGAR